MLGMKQHATSSHSKDVFLCVARKRRREPGGEDGAPPVIGIKCETDTEDNKPLLFRLVSARGLAATAPSVSGTSGADSGARLRGNVLSDEGDACPKLTVSKVSTNNGLLVDCAAHSSAQDETYMYKLDTDSRADAADDEFDFDNFSISETKPPALQKRPRCDEDVPVFIIESVPRSKVKKLAHSPSDGEQQPMDGTISLREFMDSYQNDYVDDEGEEGNENYIYYDHRKDDEFDSNAEDFSGNDYPQSADEGSATSEGGCIMEHSECSERGTHHRAQHYGMFCEDGYEERPLSEGWSSDDS